MQLIDAFVGLYKGSFVDDMREGFGRHLTPDGFEYEGEWKNDKRNGKGKKEWPNGDTYEGECWVVQSMKACQRLMRLLICTKDPSSTI